jgi:hypothetical protein
MGNYEITTSQIAAHDKTLAAGVIDTVTFDAYTDRVQIVTDGTADIYYTLDGTDPSVGGANSYKIPSAPGVEERAHPSNQNTLVVKLISAGTPKYSVQKGS